MARVALDADALIALARGDRMLRARLGTWAERGDDFIVPAPVLAEVLRDRPADAAIHRIFAQFPNALALVDCSVAAGRDAGRRLGLINGSPTLTIDALIVAAAYAHHARHIITGDADDLRRLCGDDLVVLGL